LAPGVEAKIIEERQKADAIGLIGQKGSPVVSTAKVASLKHNRLGLLGKAVNDVPAGSIGSWTIIVNRPRLQNLRPERPLRLLTRRKLLRAAGGARPYAA
jgi:hypothetical protein